LKIFSRKPIGFELEIFYMYEVNQPKVNVDIRARIFLGNARFNFAQI